VTAEEKLLSMVGGAANPVLSPDELAQCLLDSAVPDSAGFYINDDEWVPGYDFHRAAAAAWRLKAAKVAADYSVTIEGRELNRGQMIDNFLKMAAEHDTKAQPRYMAAPDTLEPWRI
jgi:hypothetical protein